MFELVDPDEFSTDDHAYEEEGEPCEYCDGGKVVATGGNHWYNGSYNCYTLYLNCENCGDYEVECV